MARALLIFFILFFCFSPPLLAEEPSQEKARLQQIEKELQEKKEKLLQTKQKEQQSLSQLVEIKKELKKAKRQLTMANQKITVNQEQIKSLRSEIKETDFILKQKEDKLSRRIREIFKNDSVNYLDLIFGARNMSDFINRSYFFSKLVETDVGLINVIAEQYRQTKHKHQKLENVTAEIKELAQVISTKKEEISEQQQQEQQVYSSLKERRQEYEKQVAQLEKSSEELTRMILSQQGKGGKRVAGSGALDWPLRGRLTSMFGYRRHPYWGGRHMHTGLDIAAPYGRPIKAADSGEVILAKWWDGYGKAVVISHGGNTSTVYGHMSRIYVQDGDNIVKGQIIGLVGSTGYSTGPHLHFEVRKNGKPQNPMGYLP